MKWATFKTEITEDLLISFGTEGSIPDDVWTDFINQLKKPAVKRYIGTSIGTVDVTSIQRKTVAEVLKSRGIAASVVTEASLVRGLVTAASWLGVSKIKAFDWTEVHQGLEHLGVTGSQQERAVAIIQRLKATHAR